MMLRSPYILLIAFLYLYTPYLSGQNDSLTGLYFSSYEVVQEKRTSLDLSPGASFRLSGRFSLAFDIQFRRDDGFYGYIFRAIGDERTNIDFVSNLASDTSNFWLVYKDQTLLSYNWEDIPSIAYNQWVSVRFDFDLDHSRLLFSMNGKEQEVSVPGLSLLKTFHLVFGACRLNAFHSTDVCPMSVKDVRLYKDDRLFRQWALGEHNRDKVYDKIAGAEASVDNPVWLIDKYIKWRKLKDIHIDRLLGITADTAVSRLFFVNDKAVYSLLLHTLEMDSIPYAQGRPYQNAQGKDIVYNPYTDELWSYDLGSPHISRFNFKTSAWSHAPATMAESAFAHNNKMISPVDSSLVSILGYGYYTYKSMVNHYNAATAQWEQTDRSEQIPPRYLSSMGRLNEYEALVFGGYGSKSGRQELAPGSYYDLYVFDLRTFSFSHLWTLPGQASPFVPSETLVINPSEDCFYTLVYNNGYYDSYLQLARYGLQSPSVELVGDSIPFKFRDTETWVYLYLNEQKSDLIALVNHNDELALYAIAYPPLTMEDVWQTPPRSLALGWYVALAAGLLLLLACFILRKKKLWLGLPPLRRGTKESIHIMLLPPAKRREQSAIYLFGEFQVFDKEGRDMTPSFSPTLKHLFLFLLLHSTNSHKGLTSAKLDETLWHDKIGDSARNNRNVNLSKLRTLLDEIGGMEISNKNALWKIELSGDMYCDYFDILEILASPEMQTLGATDIYRLLGLLSSGEFLYTLHAEWAEAPKSVFIESIAKFLDMFLQLPSTRHNTNLRYHIAEYLLSVDSLNEVALTIKCSILNQLGKQSLAKITYDAFTKEYEKLLGTPYPITFKEIVRGR
ncbi:MAG: hypothetical protein LBQ73_09230, partial [Tannerellaceae bacterium]|nr:hypothetical protein [Tannerellaceae bacterium]